MKKRIISSLAFLILMSTVIDSIYAQAPSYKNFEWEILRAGYGNLPDSDIQSSSISIGSEIRYNLTDFYSIGLGWDGVFSVSNINDDDADLEVLTNASVSLDRYFSNTSGKRAFVGFSIGDYESYRQFIRDGEDQDPFDVNRSLGLALRGGYEVGHLRLMAQYQFSTSGDVLNGFSLTAGLTLWGGYKGSSN